MKFKFRPLSFRHLRIFLLFLAMIQAFYFGIKIGHHVPTLGGDSQDYTEVRDLLRAHQFTLALGHNRPPAYPIFLLIAQALSIAPNVLSVLFNRLVVCAALILWPTTSIVLLSASYLVLMSSATLLSYENVLMTESIMPGFIFVGMMLGLIAQRSLKSSRYWFWICLLIFQTVFLASLKPGFKYIGMISATTTCAILLLSERKTFFRRSFPGFILAIVLPTTFASLAFPGSGSTALENNRVLSVRNTPVLQLDAGEYDSWPPQVRATYDAFKKYWENPPQDYNGTVVPASEGAELHRHIFWRHLPLFLKGDFIRMVKLFRYSSWNNDVGATKHSIGIRSGFGIVGILFGTFVLALALSLLLSSELVAAANSLVFVTGIFFFYNLAIEILVNSTDFDRLSLPWLIPFYSFLIVFWTLVLKSYSSKLKGQINVS